MKYIDIESPTQLPGIRLGENDTFSFRCHSGLACFNQCCRNLNLFLYPYDVIRLKHHLGISSDHFLDQYVDVVLRHSNFFPEILLRMSENNEKTCPFLTESGCSVYADRPDACRTFPVEQGIFYNAKANTSTVVHFFKPPEFCFGQYETTQWTPQTWAKDQDAEVYHQMTARWAALKDKFQIDPWGKEGPQGTRAKMSFMAAYNIDRFREFVFNSSFLKRYTVKFELRKKLKTNDTELLKFGFEWIQFYLWGISSKYFKLGT